MKTFLKYVARDILEKIRKQSQRHCRRVSKQTRRSFPQRESGPFD